MPTGIRSRYREAQAMKIEINKETLIKHRFWFLMPVIALCALIGWLCVLGVRSDAETKEKTAKQTNDKLKELAKDPEVRSPGDLTKADVKIVESVDQKVKLWIQEFDRQVQALRDTKSPYEGSKEVPPANISGD